MRMKTIEVSMISGISRYVTRTQAPRKVYILSYFVYFRQFLYNFVSTYLPLLLGLGMRLSRAVYFSHGNQSKPSSSCTETPEWGGSGEVKLLNSTEGLQEKS